MDANLEKQKIRIFDGLLRRYLNVIKHEDGYYVNESGEKLYRIETKGRTGKTLYYNGFYIMGSCEMRVQGMGGQTGHGWGGRIVGYLILDEIRDYKGRIKHIYFK